MRRLQRTVVIGALAVASSACSFLVSTNGLTGGLSGEGDSGFASVEDAASVLLDGPSLLPVHDSDAGGTEPVVEAGDSNDGDVSDRDAGPRPTDGGGEADHAVVPCGGDLSNVGTGDFTIVFDIETAEGTFAALLDQRASCGSGRFWTVHQANSNLTFEAADGASNDVALTTSGAIDDGATHTVAVARVSGNVTIRVDGAVRASGQVAISFGTLPPLAVGTDACDGDGGLVPFTGTLSNVCVTAN